MTAGAACRKASVGNSAQLIRNNIRRWVRLSAWLWKGFPRATLVRDWMACWRHAFNGFELNSDIEHTKTGKQNMSSLLMNIVSKMCQNIWLKIVRPLLGCFNDWCPGMLSSVIEYNSFVFELIVTPGDKICMKMPDIEPRTCWRVDLTSEDL